MPLSLKRNHSALTICTKQMRTFFFLFLSFVTIGSVAQTKFFNPGDLRKSLADSLERANYHLEQEEFLRALPIYVNFGQLYPDEMLFKYNKGICYLYKSDEHDKALSMLTEVYEKNKKAADINYYLGRAYLLNLKFDEAIIQFNSFLTQKLTEKKKKEVLHLVENCNNGKVLVAKPVEVKITNMGGMINSKNSEYAPLISSDQQTLIFTYTGEKSKGGMLDEKENPDTINGIYYEDVFISEKDSNDNWTPPRSIGDNINTNSHDACIAFSPDAQQLFIYKIMGSDSGDIYVSNLEGKEWQMPERLYGDVNTNYWEGSASLSSDGKTLYFSSERPGGYGQRDLYSAKRMLDNSWGNVKNLGPNVNTEWDDDAPYIHANGKLLVFSSKGHNSMGGYDIFYSDLKDTTWGPAENIGYPISEPDDDVFYVLSTNTKQGYYSSGKPGGYGEQDIYVAEPGLPGRSGASLKLVTGEVTLDEKPVRAEVVVSYADSNAVFGTFHSNSFTGIYMVNLQQEKRYTAVFKVAGMPDITKQISAIYSVKGSAYYEKIIDVEFFTEEYKKAHILIPPPVAVVDSTKIKAEEEEKNRKDKDSKKEKAKLTPTEIEAKLKDTHFKHVSYRVQVAAVKTETTKKNIKNYQKVREIDKVDVEDGKDGYTKYSLGPYKTLDEARAIKKKVTESAGIDDAFISAFYRGKRVTFKELAAKIAEDQ